MSTNGRRLPPVLFAVGACLVTGLAAWFAFRLTHPTLGAGGGALVAVVATMLVGAPFFIVGAVIWGPQDPPGGDRRRAAEAGAGNPGKPR